MIRRNHADDVHTSFRRHISAAARTDRDAACHPDYVLWESNGAESFSKSMRRLIYEGIMPNVTCSVCKYAKLIAGKCKNVISVTVSG